MASIATSTYLPPLAAPHEREGIGRELEVVLHLLVDLSLIGKQLASQDILIGVVRQLEKQQWMLRVQLKERA